MNGYLVTVQKSKNYNNYKLTADKVIQTLSDVRNERTKSRRRWIWELMQNAKDVPNIFGGVTIEIVLRNHEFIFRHNGNPFQVENITGLIQQVSSGKPSDSTNKRITGKFGTGFISTHLLADIVHVNGIVEQEGLLPKSFQFELNRKADKSEDLIDFIAKELDKIEMIEDESLFPTIQNYHELRKENDFDTVFTYPLENSESRDAASVGVEDLELTLPQTLFFVDELKKVIIKNEIIGKDITYELVDNKNEGNIFFPIVKETKDENHQYLCFIHYKDDRLDLAIPVNNHEEKQIKPIDKSARLFRDFPLVGTEQFYFPFILNGLNFHPTEKRDNVLLTDTNSNNVIVNREIFEHAINKSKVFVNWLIHNNARHLSLVAQSRIPNLLLESEVVKWYKTNIQSPYRQFLIEQKIVETDNEKIELKNAIIPKFSGTQENNEIFWDILYAYFGGEKICKKEHLKSWHENLGLESEIDTWSQKVFYTIEDLLKEIQSKITLDNIALKSTNETKIKWLNSVYKLLIDNELTKYFKDFKIIPTIKGTLKSFSDDLFIEKGATIPNEFISILKDLKNEDWNDILIHRELNPIDNAHAYKTIKNISEEINTFINGEEKDKFIYNNPEQILLRILQIRPSNSNDSFQSKLFRSATIFFNLELQQNTISGIDEFNFNPAKTQLIKLIHLNITRAETLSELGSIVANDWLLEHLLLLQGSSEYKMLLEFGRIIPNRKNELCTFSEVFSYGTDEIPLDDEIIEILFELNNAKDWNKFLIHDNFRQLKLTAKQFLELSTQIKDELKILQIENAFSTKSKAILRLIHWCSLNKNQFISDKYFEWFKTQKDKIFVNISLEDTEIGSNIVKLISNKEKLNDLVTLADSGISLSQLSEIAEIAKSVNIEEIKKLAQQLKEEQDDFEFKKKIGEAFEKAFIEVLKSENLQYNITYQGYGSHDVTITNPINGKTFFIELKSLSPLNWDKSLMLSLSQARKAYELEKDGNYAVSVIIRPHKWDSATEEFIKSNLSSLINIGASLKSVLEKDDIFDQLTRSYDDFDLIFENTNRKVRISEAIWKKNSQPIKTLIEKLKQYLE